MTGGEGLTKRCVFLDRDGVINRKAADGDYVRSPQDFELLPHISDWIRLFNKLDLLVIVVTNQRGIALGLMTEQDLESVHARMIDELALRGARVDDIFYCPHETDSCECRKPKPGLIYAARDKWQIDLEHSLLLGDSDSDAQLASACGVPFLRVSCGKLEKQ
jgi:D-glycero-D-manno-heptose 1,7-bisphosphate phosphatase